MVKCCGGKLEQGRGGAAVLEQPPDQIEGCELIKAVKEARERAIWLPGGGVFPACGKARNEAQRREGNGV